VCMSPYGPKREFAAVQRYGRCRWNTGRSVDAAHTAASDRERTRSYAPPRPLFSRVRLV
jgi:hypothetical protein